MQRYAPLLLALLCGLTCLFYVARQPAHTLAVSYPAGWNLVSGPDGSTLTGAAGSLYSFQPGDSNYQVFPDTATLRAGWGYWAYFPSGGTLVLGTDATTYTVTLNEGDVAMIGDPSGTGAANISGVDSALTYATATGYRQAVTLQPGQGAWVFGPATITLTAQAAPASAAAPSPTRAALPAFTYDDLRKLALHPDDLPGYSLNMETSSTVRGATAGYSALWVSSSAGRGVVEVIAALTTAGSPNANVIDLASAFLTDSRYSNQRNLGSQSIGDADMAISVQSTMGSTTLEFFIENFQRGNVVVSVGIAFPVGTGSITPVLPLARLLDQRVQSAITPAPTSGPPGFSGQIAVAASLNTQTCNGGNVRITIRVTYANGAPVHDANARGHVQYQTTGRDFTFPLTDATGQAIAEIDTGEVRGGYTVVWTVDASANGYTAHTSTTCYAP